MKIKCSYCNKLGHLDSACYLKKRFVRNNKINFISEHSHLNKSERLQKDTNAKKMYSDCNKSDHTKSESYNNKISLRRTNP